MSGVALGDSLQELNRVFSLMVRDRRPTANRMIFLARGVINASKRIDHGFDE
jgi:hypothetical protein